MKTLAPAPRFLAHTIFFAGVFLIKIKNKMLINNTILLYLFYLTMLVCFYPASAAPKGNNIKNNNDSTSIQASAFYNIQMYYNRYTMKEYMYRKGEDTLLGHLSEHMLSFAGSMTFPKNSLSFIYSYRYRKNLFSIGLLFGRPPNPPFGFVKPTYNAWGVNIQYQYFFNRVTRWMELFLGINGRYYHYRGGLYFNHYLIFGPRVNIFNNLYVDVHSNTGVPQFYQTQFKEFISPYTGISIADVPISMGLTINLGLKIK